MKALKLSKEVQIILATMFVIVVGVIIILSISNDELMGYDDTTGETTGKAKPIELFDAEGTNIDGLHIGDFVNYDAGIWTQEEIDNIQAGDETLPSTANGSTDLPTTNLQFGGFATDSSRNGNVTPSSSSYNYITDISTGNAVTGWRVFDINDDGTVTLISAGNPEAFCVFRC